MDRLTRTSIIISGILLVLLIVSLAWSRFGATPRVWQLNALLEEDPVLAQYPYQFRVVLFLNGIATLTSPHASQVPIEPFLRAIDPALAAKPNDEKAMAAALERFRQQEMRAVDLLYAEPDVESAAWSLDRAWYHQHRVPLEGR